jgi:hypothetical protein
MICDRNVGLSTIYLNLSEESLAFCFYQDTGTSRLAAIDHVLRASSEARKFFEKGCVHMSPGSSSNKIVVAIATAAALGIACVSTVASAGEVGFGGVYAGGVRGGGFYAAGVRGGAIEGVGVRGGGFEAVGVHGGEVGGVAVRGGAVEGVGVRGGEVGGVGVAAGYRGGFYRGGCFGVSCGR